MEASRCVAEDIRGRLPSERSRFRSESDSAARSGKAVRELLADENKTRRLGSLGRRLVSGLSVDKRLRMALFRQASLGFFGGWGCPCRHCALMWSKTLGV